MISSPWKVDLQGSHMEKKNHKILAVKSAVKFRNSSVLQFPGPAALLGIISFRKKKIV